jgi:hypothetical protein
MDAGAITVACVFAVWIGVLLIALLSPWKDQ